MPDSIPLQVWDAMLAALNTDRPSGIPETTLCSLDQVRAENLPWISLYPIAETIEVIGNKNDAVAVARACGFQLEVRAKGSDAVRDAEALRTHVVSRLGGAKLDGLVERVHEVGTTWAEAEGDPPHVLARMSFRYEVPTLISDLTTRPGRPS
jgi:hypothetical protein